MRYQVMSSLFTGFTVTFVMCLFTSLLRVGGQG